MLQSMGWQRVVHNLATEQQVLKWCYCWSRDHMLEVTALKHNRHPASTVQRTEPRIRNFCWRKNCTVQPGSDPQAASGWLRLIWKHRLHTEMQRRWWPETREDNRDIFHPHQHLAICQSTQEVRMLKHVLISSIISFCQNSPVYLLTILQLFIVDELGYLWYYFFWTHILRHIYARPNT